MDKVEEAVIKHSIMLESQTGITEELRNGIRGINRKLEDFAELFSKQNDMMNRIVTLEDKYQDSISRVHIRIDETITSMKELAKAQTIEGCSVLNIKEAKHETKLVELVETTRTQQKRIDKIEANTSKLVWLILSFVVLATLKLVVIG